MHHVQLADADAFGILCITRSPVDLPPQQQLELKQEELLEGHAVPGSMQVGSVDWVVHVLQCLQKQQKRKSVWAVRSSSAQVVWGLAACRLAALTGLCMCSSACRSN